MINHPATAWSILVVDDEQMMARAVGRGLGRDHKVVPCPSGDEALSLLARGQRFDVLLADVRMPTMTGLAFFQRLRALVPDQAERVGFITAGGSPQVEWQGLMAAGRPVLVKPFSNERLRGFVCALAMAQVRRSA